MLRKYTFHDGAQFAQIYQFLFPIYLQATYLQAQKQKQTEVISFTREGAFLVSGTLNHY